MVSSLQNCSYLHSVLYMYASHPIICKLFQSRDYNYSWYTSHCLFCLPHCVIFKITDISNASISSKSFYYNFQAFCGQKTVKQEHEKHQLWVFLNKKKTPKIISDSLSMFSGIHSESVCFELILTWIDCYAFSIVCKTVLK